MNKLDTSTITDIIEWDILNWAQLIPYWQPILQNLPADSKILAIGERNGGITLWLALNGFHVVCSDRTLPTKAAIEMHKKYNVSDKITYIAFDIVNNRDETNKYDLIIAKSVLGGIKSDPKNANTRTTETRENAVNNIYNLLNPGGYILFAENIKGSMLIHKTRTWLGKQKGWFYFSLSDIKTLFKNFRDIEIKTFGVLPTTFKNQSINQFIFTINKYCLGFLPSSYKYVAFIKGRKP